MAAGANPFVNGLAGQTFVGRNNELDLVETRLRRLRAGQPMHFFIAGTNGTGKCTHMHWLRNAGCALMIGALVACGGNDGDGAEAATETTTATESDATDATTTTETEAEDLTIDAFLASLTDAGLPVGQSTVWDESTDPNELLGRPGQYVAKATWTDTRVECFSDPSGVDCGGDIEIFENTDDRDERYEYLAGFADQAAIGGYYQWRLPNAVVRVGFELTPSQAEEYAAVFEQLAPGEVEQLG